MGLVVSLDSQLASNNNQTKNRKQNNINKDFPVLVPRGGVFRNGGKLRTLPRHEIELVGTALARGGSHVQPYASTQQKKGRGTTGPMWR